ncbi:peptide chain release factor N(5)-glutamine methyltransferase [Advenella alkanexedens]|uniref:Release factor glutamine methyltransferase n=1 Tax=Advenella alkanexedens TaxID=1481665 RepID=A0ABS6NS53_9BURK|nr:MULTISPECIES: peptide chain release factor N(5)-glutamine methyltransferase [Advenella]MBV4398036.1 peptide chain release factor N(5)-glutamine methyltransferase [Advenella alkanexedens]MDD3758486.1 peptide chain release factor N(5)-glutamine methyltransferase [Advenella sp.]
MNTVHSVIAQSGLPLLEARMIVGHVLNVSRAWMIAHDSDAIDMEHLESIQDMFRRRLAGEPMAYILGQREFMGLVFKTNPSVLIPRPDTELLVEIAIDLLQNQPGAMMLDMGTGSGAIAVSVAHYCPQAVVMASDKSAEALAVARENAQNLAVRVGFVESDWYEQLPAGKFDLIVSNPPYIHHADSHLEQGDLRFEPPQALTDFSDGLSAIRKIIAGAGDFLRDGGWVWLEHGWDQAENVRSLLIEAGFVNVESRKDLSGIERISGGQWAISE